MTDNDTRQSRARLPLELILEIMSSLLPERPHSLLPSHETAKTLLSFTRVSRGTSRLASRYLIEYCWAYIGSHGRLRDMCWRLERAATPTAPTPNVFGILGNLTALYLAPFESSLAERGHAGRRMVWWVSELLDHVQHTLRRLVIDMPLHDDDYDYYDDYDDDDFEEYSDETTMMREGFMKLTRLEEFVNVRAELSRDWLDGRIWTFWPELRRLALCKQDEDERF